MAQRPPLRVQAFSSTGRPATFIFLHGFGDDAEGFINIAHQFQRASKLPHLTWIFPNAPHNHEALANAWYTPHAFSPIPIGKSSQDEPPESDDNIDEDDPVEVEILRSVEYLCSLIDAEVEAGVDVKRIVIGGFSQGCAISLVTGLASRHGGRIGGVVGLSGYLPEGKCIRKEMEGYVEVEETMKVFLAHGMKDMLIPMRIFRSTKDRVNEAVGEESMDVREYEGMGHVCSGPELRDMCKFLEKVVPE